jgi:hypothetical protein
VRETNAIDFWRGFALVTIFVNHVPGNIFENVTHRNVSLSDSAELFVFLAGWSVALATGGRAGTVEPSLRVILRLSSRTVEIYRAQLVITALALAFIATSALVTRNPLLLEWHNAAPVFYDPIRATVGWVSLFHQLGYFNILPLYVVLMAFAPVFVLLARASRALVFAVSFGVYLATLTFALNLPSWPVGGHWFFSPFAWQFLFVLGFLAAGAGGELRATWVRRLRPLAWLVLAAGAVVAITDYNPDPLAVPQPALFFLKDKTHLSPARLVHLLALCVAFSGAFRHIDRLAPALSRQLSGLGRNSLAVFCVGSLASLGGQFARYFGSGGIVVDVVVIGAGIWGMLFTAWFVEWRERTRPSRPQSEA